MGGSIVSKENSRRKVCWRKKHEKKITPSSWRASGIGTLAGGINNSDNSQRLDSGFVRVNGRGGRHAEAGSEAAHYTAQEASAAGRQVGRQAHEGDDDAG